MSKRKPKAGFVKRTGQMYQNHRRRAKDDGSWVDYTAEELRVLIQAAIRRGTCPYCGLLLDGDNFSADHQVPVCRGGKHAMCNLVICCRRCNLAKGPLDYIEFKELLNVLSRWPDELKANTLARLKAGSRYAKLPVKPKELAEKAPDKNRRGKWEWLDLNAGEGQRKKIPVGKRLKREEVGDGSQADGDGSKRQAKSNRGSSLGERIPASQEPASPDQKVA